MQELQKKQLSIKRADKKSKRRVEPSQKSTKIKEKDRERGKGREREGKKSEREHEKTVGNEASVERLD